MSMHEHRNEVQLIGRITREAVLNQLPSGSIVASVWLTIDRPAIEVVRPSKQTYDSVELVAWRTAAQEMLTELQPKDVVAVSGAIRHRFWQGSGGLRSKYEIEVDDAVVVYRAAGPGNSGADLVESASSLAD